MLTDEKTESMARSVTEEIEITPFVERQHVTHHDQYVEYSHDLPEDTSEASSRSLVRVVPLAYGVLLGGLADNMLLGLSVGAMASAAFDWHMRTSPVAGQYHIP